EDVVHEEQNVLTLVAEVFSNRQTGKGNTSAGTRGFVHLTVHEGCLGAFAAAELVNARLDHFMVKVVTFTGTLTDACEHGVTAVRLGDVVDEFHDENGLANACTAEEADLAALGVRSEKVNDLDARDQNFGFGRLLDIFRSALVDGAGCRGLDRTGFVDRLTDDVHDAAKRFDADRNHDRLAGVACFLTTNQTFGRIHGDGAHGVFAEVLGDFENQAVALVVDFKRVQDQRQLAFRELDVDDSA